MPQTILLNREKAGKSFWQKVLNNPVPYFLGGWFIVNCIQAGLTQLTSDEGYYWFYARHLQWGYYDHPPMVALMIKAGSLLFPGELGVRLFNVAFSTGALYLFFNLLPGQLQKSRKTFLVVLSAPLVHYLAFVIFPDGPLLFFSVLFLVLYKRFLKEQTVLTAAFLGLSIALMAWSKYHGALMVFFTVLAHPKLLRSGFFYLALLVALLLFTPHLWWQYRNNFPTLRYHLSGRTGNYSFRHVGEYLSQQLIAIGPGLIFIPFVSKAKDIFERTLLFIIIGTFAFFLFSSLKTFVHFHWTSIAIFPLLYFAVSYYNSPQKSRLFNSLALPFVVLFFVVRLLLIIPIIPAMHAGEDYYHGRKAWAEEINVLAGGRPVFMPGNLREASLYSFYSGSTGVALYSRPQKKSQYELWGYEDSLQGREVLFVTKHPFSGSKPLPNNLQQNLYYALLTSFRSYYAGVSIAATITRQQADTINAELDITNHRSTPLAFDGLNNETTTLVCSVEQEGKILKEDVLQTLSGADTIAPSGHSKNRVAFSVKGLSAGSYDVYFGIRNGVLPDAILSNPNSIIVY